MNFTQQQSTVLSFLFSFITILKIGTVLKNDINLKIEHSILFSSNSYYSFSAQYVTRVLPFPYIILFTYYIKLKPRVVTFFFCLKPVQLISKKK